MAELAQRHGRPVVAIGGRVTEAAQAAFTCTVAASPPDMPLDEAMRRAPELIEAAIIRAAPALRHLMGG